MEWKEHPYEGLETTSIRIGLNTSLFVVQNETPSTLKNRAKWTSEQRRLNTKA